MIGYYNAYIREQNNELREAIERNIALRTGRIYVKHISQEAKIPVHVVTEDEKREDYHRGVEGEQVYDPSDPTY